MSDMWKAYDCLKDEGYTHLTVNHSLNFVDLDTGAHTQRIENTWWGVKRSMPNTEHPKISSKATHRNACGVSTMETILFENQVYRRLIWSMQRCVNWSVPRTTVCSVRDLIVASWRKETKYTASTHGKELEEGNQKEKNDQRHDVGICTDFIFRRFNLKEIQLYSLTRSTLYS